jgi:hypothetical protein
LHIISMTDHPHLHLCIMLLCDVYASTRCLFV